MSTWRRGDLEPPLRIELTDTGNPDLDLTTATSVRVLIARAGTIVVDDTTPDVAPAPSPGTWIITHHWQPGQTDTPGIHLTEVEVVWPGVRPQTFPPDRPLTLTITDDIA